MKFAYADPPYLGCGKLYVKDHPDALAWDDPQTHLNLLDKLVNEYPDGWALSCNPKDLGLFLSNLPDTVRVGAWCKSFASFKPNVNPAYTWEPVIWDGGRKRTRKDLTTKDHLIEPIQLKKGLTGAKPDRFNRWILDLLGFQEGDQLDDLFPGTDGMAATLAQGMLL